MARRVVMRIPNDTAPERYGYEGFSWTVFFFGPFPMICRGDFGMALLTIVLSVVVAWFTFGIGAWIVWIIIAFIYNARHMDKRIAAGYRKV